MLTHYLMKEEITKNASRFSEVHRVTKARYAFSFSSKDGKIGSGAGERRREEFVPAKEKDANENTQEETVIKEISGKRI